MGNCTHLGKDNAHRSFHVLVENDLKRLVEIQSLWLDEIACRLPSTCGLYQDRVLMVCLAQGGACHYLDSTHGIKDLDVWTFFRAQGDVPFPSRTVWKRDFGPSHFGKHPDDEGYLGRRVDLIGRSIEFADGEEAAVAVRRWLTGPSKSAAQLRKAPLVGLIPAGAERNVIWQPSVLEPCTGGGRPSHAMTNN